jgi:hypothetical protein
VPGGAHYGPTIGGVELDPVSEIFLMHGFYRAGQMSGEYGVWNGDRGNIGYAQDDEHPNRRTEPLVDGATIGLTLQTTDSQAISDADIVIATYRPGEPNDGGSFARRAWDGSPLYFAPLPTDQEELVAIWAEANGHRSTEIATFTNAEYWAAVISQSGENALELAFTMDPAGPSTDEPPAIPFPADWPPPGGVRLPFDTTWTVAAPANGLAAGDLVILPSKTVVNPDGTVTAGATVVLGDGSALVLSEPLPVTNEGFSFQVSN